MEFCEGLEVIGEQAFNICNSLRSIKFPSTIKVISQCAFEGCTGLEDVEICEGLEVIGERAFNSCNSLTYVHIPSTLKQISRGAFGNCDQLEMVDLSDKLAWGKILRLLINAEAPP